jgi:hypothetical protein
MKYTAALLMAAFFSASQPAFAAARVAVAHFAPFADSIDATAVNIAVNGDVALENVKFKDFTGYLEFEAGSYTVDIIPVGASDPAITAELVLEDGNDYSAVAVGNGTSQPLGIWVLSDNTSDPITGNLNIRVVHTAPFAEDLDDTEVSIRTAGGDVVNNLEAVPYGVSSGFFEVPAGTYDLKVASVDGSVNYIDPLPADSLSRWANCRLELRSITARMECGKSSKGPEPALSCSPCLRKTASWVPGTPTTRKATRFS